MRQWAKRTAALHGELAALADVRDLDPRWWLLAGGAALSWSARGTYVLSDAEPSSDTFIGHPAAAPADPFAHAIARAHATRAAIRALDGELPEQPLAVTIERGAQGAITEPSSLDIVAFAIGERIVLARLAGTSQIKLVDRADVTPFVTISVGDEPLATARHGHRRGWTINGVSRGPWLGLSRAGNLDIASTCHMAVDGYGHAWLAAEIAKRAASIAVDRTSRDRLAWGGPPPLAPVENRFTLPPLRTITDEFPLGVAWRELTTRPRALPLAYALGRLLHRVAGKPDARFSPTFQIPVAGGAPNDPERRRYRHVPAIASVRFDGGTPEPFAEFEARTRALLTREAEGAGLTSRLLAAARGAPAPLAWKRHAIGSTRPRWLEPIAELIGGRGCLSRLRLHTPMPASIAVSSPSRIATESDPIGGVVVTVVDDGERATLTLCGSGIAGTDTEAAQVMDELLGFVGEL